MNKATSSLMLLSLMLISSVTAVTDDTYTYSSLQVSCLIYDSLSFYDLRDMTSTTHYSIKESDGDTIYFNLCSYTDSSCASNHSVFAYKKNNDSTCNQLTDNQVSSLTESLVDNVVYLNISGGEQCSVQNSAGVKLNYTFTVGVLCDSEGNSTDAPNILNGTTDDYCNVLVYVSHASGCAVFSPTTWFSVLFADQAILSGPLLMILGLLMGFIGLKFFKYTIGVFGLLLGFGTTYLLFVMLTLIDEMSDSVSSDDSSDSSFYIFLLKILSASIVGIFVGYILTRMLHIGAAILGGLAGQFIAFFFYSLFGVHSTYFFVFLSLIFDISLAVLSFKYYDHIVIFSTSFIGSYAVIRGISLFAGHFPTESDLYQLIVNGQSLSTEWQYWLYLTGCLILFGLGFAFQWISRNKDLFKLFKSKVE